MHFRHALALDEHRVKYIPYYWTKDPEVTDVKEVFFAGVHCGAFWLLRIHQISYLPMPFQMSGVDL